MKRFIFLLTMLFSLSPLAAGWYTHFAYNSVNRIAGGNGEVYGVSSGALFSVNAITEQYTLYGPHTGMHAGMQVVEIAWLEQENALLIFYAGGQVDVLKNGTFSYVPDLYQNETTLSKKCNGITIVDSLAWLAMDYGIQTFNIHNRTFKDTYFIGARGREVKVVNVVLLNGYIYAEAENGTVYYAPNNSQAVDYRYWQSTATPSSSVREALDEAFANRQNVYMDGEHWQAGNEEGIIRYTIDNQRLTYRVDGPLNNQPYRLYYTGGQLFMLQGGRWATQNSTPGTLSRLKDGQWHNLTADQMLATTGAKYCYDIMNAAVDEHDNDHFFLTSYGTGLYEFRGDECIAHYMPSADNLIGTAAANDPQRYTRLDGAIYDDDGNLWMVNASSVPYNILVYTPNGQWYGMNVKNAEGARYPISTPSELILDSRQPGQVWVAACRTSDGRAGLAVTDNRNTLDDESDDLSIIRFEWENQDGEAIMLAAIYDIAQDEQGTIWIASSDGVYYIPSSVDYYTQAICYELRIIDEDGNQLLDNEAVNTIYVDNLNRKWIGSVAQGVYVLSSDGEEILAHYTMDNSTLPSNAILSLALDTDHGRMYIGSGTGLVSVDVNDVTRYDYVETDEEHTEYGAMQNWRTHFAYNSISQLAQNTARVFALSDGALCAIDKQDETITYFSTLEGLNGSSICQIGYDRTTHQLLIAYEDGKIDLMADNEQIVNIADLYLKQMTTDKSARDIVFANGIAYMAMPFGVMAVNMRKHEIKDTYFMGAEGTYLPINRLALRADTLYAQSEDSTYFAPLSANLVDYNVWQKIADTLAVAPLPVLDGYQVTDTLVDGSTIWYATNEGGVIRRSANGNLQIFSPDGPLTNLPYNMTWANGMLYTVPGGRWAAGYERRDGHLNRFDGSTWHNLSYQTIRQMLGQSTLLLDLGHVAVDPTNPNRFAVSSFGSGLLLFGNAGNQVSRYTFSNSPLLSAIEGKNFDMYVRVDAITFDPQGNLWLTNTGSRAKNLHVVTPDGTWYSYNLYANGARQVLNTVSAICVDNRDSKYLWIASARETSGIAFLNTNGTPNTGADDRAVFRTTFIDQDNKAITPNRIMTIAQASNGDMWVGTGEGLFIIEAATNIFTSNACKRLKISRHDGTNLADYLLGTEQINDILFASDNRIWIATDNSGVYLVRMVTKEGIYEPEIMAHFTTTNSPMPSDCVLSLAADEQTADIYIGTAKGLVSYRSDASAPSQNFSTAYAYPNPVRPNYQGVLTIQGLMDNTTVYIADAAGNVIARTHSNGGTAIWDLKNSSGQRVRSGVYSIFCNTADGQNHAVIKVLVMN